MNGPDQQLPYNLVARWLHWTIGSLVIANILLGLFHDGLGKMIPAMPLHKAIGVTVLFLTLVRIGWRLGHRPPPLPAAMPSWEKGAAHLTHFVFYALLLILPLTGWIMVSAGDRPLKWFWLFDIPKFGVTRSDAAYGLSEALHEPLGLILGALALIHIAAALRHHIVLKDNVLRRMLG
jgi:cytochrome b561